MTKKASDTSTASKTASKETAAKAAASNSKKSAEKKKQDISAEKKAKKKAETAFASEKKKLEKKISEETEKAKEWQDKYMRLSAEFDNYRKRTLKEKSDLIKTANENLLVDILSVVDDFERGIDTIDKSEDLQALKDGIHLIHNKFNSFLKQKGIKEIDAKEQEFDLDLHEAMTKIPAPDESLKGKVVDVIEKGYTLNEKVIRYAKVVVGD